jgi:hypothetical protein
MSDALEERVFTVPEAEALLDELRERLPRLRDARHRLIETSRRIEAAVAADGGGIAGSAWFEAQQTLRNEVTFLATNGILLKDPESGLVDFPADREGRRVLLCWRLGEERLGWYHEVSSGYSGRRPL